MSKIRLVSFDLCPFVQRSAIALHEKGVEYDIEYVDLADKPGWFLEKSPLGKVPILEVGDAVLFESAVICEYLDEAYGEPLHPRDPLERARDRAWIVVSEGLGGAGYMVMVGGEEEVVRKEAAKARGVLERLEGEIVGPLWRGDAMCVVDCAAAPMLQRLWWAEEIVDLGIFSGLERCTSWVKSLMERPSVQRSTIPEIRERYRAYLRGDRSPTSQTEASWLGRQLPA
ncbi:MAG: glutathione S-transferase family protein [Polyangiaceae bacterium]